VGAAVGGEAETVPELQEPEVGYGEAAGSWRGQCADAGKTKWAENVR